MDQTDIHEFSSRSWLKVLLLLLYIVVLSLKPMVAHCSDPNLSQTDLSTSEAVSPQKVGTNEPQGELVIQSSFISSREFWLSLIILLFGLAVIIAEYTLLKGKNNSAEEITRVFAVTLIVIGTLFLITASYSNNQIAPAMGLFGTIAGYLLGKKTGPNNEICREED